METHFNPQLILTLQSVMKIINETTVPFFSSPPSFHCFRLLGKEEEEDRRERTH
jgi:hypothetical protein